MKRFYWLTCLAFALPAVSFAQIELVVTIKGGSSTTACTDFLGPADPLWQVNIDNQGWAVYPAAGACFTALPHVQYRRNFACPADLPPALEVCFAAFENDDIGFEIGAGCGVSPSCGESICQPFALPMPGDSLDYTLTLPAGGRSGGSVSFTIAVRTAAGGDNDLICTAADLGVLEYGGKLGDALQGGYHNRCATIAGDINPFDIGGWINDAGVWFTFSTGDDPGPYLTVRALNDPQSAGDSLGIELAIFSSDNNACDGVLRLLAFQFNRPDLNNEVSLICPQPNTRYYVMVDGGPELGTDRRGFFGIQVSDIGIEEAPDDRCDAEDLGIVPEGGSVGTNGWRSNFCGTSTRDPFVRAFQSQHSVWFKFTAPPSGHVRIEGVSDTSAVPLGIQLAAYRVSSRNCNGFFRHLESVFTDADLDEVLELQCLFPGEELYVLIDGSGSHGRGVFALTVYDAGDITPVFTQDITICAGQSIRVANTIYDDSGTYRDTINIFAGCDSVVVTNLTVLETIQASLEVVQPAVGAGADNGIATVSATGGQGAYTYAWCNGESGPRNERLTGGAECCVTVTDELGCEEVVCFTVPQVLPLEPAFQGDTVVCYGEENGRILFSVREGRAPYGYAWQSEDGKRTGAGEIATADEPVLLTGLGAGRYQVRISDAYFDTAFLVEILEPEPLEITVARLVEPSCHGLCDGKVELAVAGGNGGYVWNWSDEDLAGPTPAEVCAGEYAVVATDVKGCRDTLSINVEEPPPFTVKAAVIKPVSCFGGHDGEAGVSTNGRPIQYNWNNGQSEAVIGGLAAGNYAVTVTNQDGCQTAASVIVSQPNAPVTAIIDRPAPISCAGSVDGVLTATAVGPGRVFTYRWNNGANTARIGNLGPGRYAVTVSNEAGCTAEASESLEAPPPIEAQLTRKDITCLDPPDGGHIEVTAANGGRPGYRYSLDGVLFRESPVFERLRQGTYTVTVRDAAGCEADFDVQIFGPPVLIVSLGGDRTIQLGETVRLVPASNSVNLSVVWDPLPEGAAQGDLIVELQPIRTARYRVTATDNATFCTAGDEVLIEVKKDRKIYLPNVFNPRSQEEKNRSFMVFGGPGIEQVKALRIFDRQGGLVFAAGNFQPNDPDFAWDGMRNGRPAPAGVYVYTLEVTFIDGETEIFAGDVSLLR